MTTGGQRNGAEAGRTIIDANDLKVQIERKTGATVAVISGRLDGTNAPAFQSSLESTLDDSVSALLLDLKDLIYISSAGLRALLVIARLLQEQSAAFGVCSLSESVHEVFQISGFENFIQVHSDQDAALSFISR